MGANQNWARLGGYVPLALIRPYAYQGFARSFMLGRLPKPPDLLRKELLYCFSITARKCVMMFQSRGGRFIRSRFT